MSDLEKSVCDYIDTPFTLFLSGAFLGLLILFFSSFMPSLFRKKESELILGFYKFGLSIIVLFCAAIIIAIMSHFYQASTFLSGILVSAALFSLLFEMKSVFFDSFMQLFNTFITIPNSTKADIEKRIDEVKKEFSKGNLEEDILEFFKKK